MNLSDRFRNTLWGEGKRALSRPRHKLWRAERTRGQSGRRRAAARLCKNFRLIEALTASAHRGDLAELFHMALIHMGRWRNKMFALLTILTVLIATMFVGLVASTLRELRNESADPGERALWKTSR